MKTRKDPILKALASANRHETFFRELLAQRHFLPLELTSVKSRQSLIEENFRRGAMRISIYYSGFHGANIDLYRNQRACTSLLVND